MPKDERMERRKMISPNEGKIAMSSGSMSAQPIPGAHQKNNVLNDPNVVGSFMQERSSLDTGGSKFLYGEEVPSAQTIDPSKVARSPLQQNTPITTRGHMKGVPFNAPLPGQPDISGRSPQTDMMQSALYTQRIPDGIPKGPMGLQGMPAMPGSINPLAPGTSGPELMPGNGGIVPGEKMAKINKKGKRVA